MDEQNKVLLNKVINNRLEKVLANPTETEEDKQAFKEAMEATKTLIEVEKIETSHQEQLKKMEMEDKRDRRNEKIKLTEAQKDRIVQIGIFTAGLLVAPYIENKFNRALAEFYGAFEKDYNWTTSFGRALANSVFRSKKR